MYPTSKTIAPPTLDLVSMAQDLVKINPKEYLEPPPPTAACHATGRDAHVAALARRAELGQSLWHVGDTQHDPRDSRGRLIDATPPAGRQHTVDLVRQYVRRFGLLPVKELAHVLRLSSSAVAVALAKIRRDSGQT